MPKSPLRIINREENHIQIYCPCGTYVHDIQPGDDGELDYQFYLVNKKDGSLPGARASGSATETTGKKKRFVLFAPPERKREEDEEEEDEDGKDGQ